MQILQDITKNILSEYRVIRRLQAHAIADHNQIIKKIILMFIVIRKMISIPNWNKIIFKKMMKELKGVKYS